MDKLAMRFLLFWGLACAALAASAVAYAANAPAGNACTLIPVATAAKTLHAHGVETQYKASESVCHYFTGDANNMFSRKDLLMVKLKRKAYTNAAHAAARIKHMWALFGMKAKFKHVEGLGEAAFLAFKSPLTTLYVFADGARVDITIHRPPTAATTTLLKQLAHVALAHLAPEASP